MALLLGSHTSYCTHPTLLLTILQGNYVGIPPLVHFNFILFFRVDPLTEESNGHDSNEFFCRLLCCDRDDVMFDMFLLLYAGPASARSSSRAATSCCASVTRAWVIFLFSTEKKKKHIPNLLSILPLQANVTNHRWRIRREWSIRWNCLFASSISLNCTGKLRVELFLFDPEYIFCLLPDLLTSPIAFRNRPREDYSVKKHLPLRLKHTPALHLNFKFFLFCISYLKQYFKLKNQ